MKKQMVAALLVFGSAMALAQEASPPSVRLFGNFGYGFGGDTLASGTYTNGSTYEVKAGTGVQFAIGADARVAEKVTIQGSVGYHSHSTTASNGEIAFKRTPIELLAFYDVTKQFRLGGGVRKSTGAEMTVSGAAVGSAAAGKYDSSTGAVLEGQYFFSPAASTAGSRKAQFGLSLRYVTENYTLQNSNTGAKNGNHGAIGLVMYY
jgi:hypothetical protein